MTRSMISVILSQWEFRRTTESENVSTEWGERGCFKVSDVGEVLYL
jgi:hypothetical protein